MDHPLRFAECFDWAGSWVSQPSWESAHVCPMGLTWVSIRRGVEGYVTCWVIFGTVLERCDTQLVQSARRD